jgi:hypothetical protein
MGWARCEIRTDFGEESFQKVVSWKIEKGMRRNGRMVLSEIGLKDGKCMKVAQWWALI